jgi:hypothetical protein
MIRPSVYRQNYDSDHCALLYSKWEGLGKDLQGPEFSCDPLGSNSLLVDHTNINFSATACTNFLSGLQQLEELQKSLEEVCTL